MSILRKLPIPRRLSARVWLITLPSAIVSAERRSRVPKLPIGVLRYLGIPLIALGALLVIQSARHNNAEPDESPLARLGNPATAGGLVALAGVGLLFRSLALCAYSIGLAVADRTSTIAIEQPSPSMLLGSDEEE